MENLAQSTAAGLAASRPVSRVSDHPVNLPSPRSNQPSESEDDEDDEEEDDEGLPEATPRPSAMPGQYPSNKGKEPEKRDNLDRKILKLEQQLRRRDRQIERLMRNQPEKQPASLFRRGLLFRSQERRTGTRH